MSRVLRSLHSEQGNILVMTILILFAVSIIGTTLAMISSTDLKISGNQRSHTEALYVAEAGINEAVHRLSLRNPTVMTVGGWTGNVAISDTPPFDPNWKARIYMTNPGSAPAGGASDFHTGTVQNLSGDHMEYSQPSGTDGVLTIEHKWEDLDSDGVRDAGEIVLYDNEQVPAENFVSGYPVEVITVTGRVGQGSRGIEAEVTRFPAVGRTLGALFVDKAIDVTGSAEICGYNHDINTPVGSVPKAFQCFAWHLGGNHLAGVTTTGDTIVNSGSANLVGFPDYQDTSPSNPFYSLAQTLGVTDYQLSRILDNADNTSIVEPLNGITYIQGNCTVNSNLTGKGLLYVTGDLDGNGGFTYEGIIYVEGDLKFTGNPWILGTMIVRGTTDFNFSSGSCAILYCQEAVQQAIRIYLPMMRLSWREM